MNQLITNTAYTVLVIALVSWMVGVFCILYSINQHMEILIHNHHGLAEMLDMIWSEMFVGEYKEMTPLNSSN